jgi:hypothetical protein
MKIRVYDSDGDFKGGLFKTKSFNAMNCRVWQGPPHPNYRESLIDIAGKGNPCHEGSWFRLQIAAVPNISGPPDGSDDYDDNSRAYRIRASEAAAWLARHSFPVPDDLKALIGPTAASSSPTRPVAEIVAMAPLPDGLRETWAALEGRSLSAKQLAQALRTTEEGARKRIAQLNHLGRAVHNRRGAGYFRPDAPPPDGVPGARQSG